MDTMDEELPPASQQLEEDVLDEAPSKGTYIPPSITPQKVTTGTTYSHFSPTPSFLLSSPSTECVMGVDEAGRGPVLGPMVYAVYYLPRDIETSLLADTHSFNDSKVLTAPVRSSLMRTLCMPGSDLHEQSGWAARLLSAQDIGAGMLQAGGAYNLNVQAMDATVALIKGVLDQGINVKELYVDTIGKPEIYQRKLERVFPTLRITVATKADSLYPCVSAASVVAKVTRDAALETCAEFVARTEHLGEGQEREAAALWGSGYPSDARCVGWMKRSMDPVFGWGPETRFSWSTAKEMLEGKASSVRVDWPVDDEDGDMKMTSFFTSRGEEVSDELIGWYGRRVGEEVF